MTGPRGLQVHFTAVSGAFNHILLFFIMTYVRLQWNNNDVKCQSEEGYKNVEKASKWTLILDFFCQTTILGQDQL